MNKSIGSVFLAFMFLTSLLSACATASTHVPPTPTLTPIPLPATPTKLPTITPMPTIEPPSVVTEFLTDVKILSYDPFDNMNYWDFDNQTSTLTNGVVEIRGKSFWASGLWLKREFIEDDGLILKFKVQKANEQSEFTFSTNDWQTDGFRQFGIYPSKRPIVGLWQGKNGLGGNKLSGGLILQPDTWYNIMMAIGMNGQFLAVIWDPINESHRAVYNETLGEKWMGRSWRFAPIVNVGETVSVSGLYRFSFGGIK